MASDVQSAMPGRQLMAAGVLMIIIAAPLVLVAEWYMLIPAAAGAFLVVHWFASRASNSLGGLTGDVYGALSEIGEVAALLGVCVTLN